MKIIRKYIEYLKDNPEHLWFKRKLYGWGWTPARWQGWLIILVFIVFLIWNGFSLGPDENIGTEQITWFFGRIIISVSILITICYKTGEKPKWQWGASKK